LTRIVLRQAMSRAAISRLLVVAAVMSALAMSAARGYAQSDPLPSWNDGTAKKSIVDFVQRITREGGPDFVPVPERIATFENDGTLWTEQPNYFQSPSR
jgi:hypothetical protein